jgi:hypothetical protein
MWNYNPESAGDFKVGEVILLEGKKVVVTKKTNYCISVRDYRWYEELLDKLWRIVGKRS